MQCLPLFGHQWVVEVASSTSNVTWRSQPTRDRLPRASSLGASGGWHALRYAEEHDQSPARGLGGLPPLQRSSRLPSLPIVTPPAAKSQAQKRRRRGKAARRRTNAPFGGIAFAGADTPAGSTRPSAYLRVCHPLKGKAAAVPRLCSMVPTNRPTRDCPPWGWRQFHHRLTPKKKQAFREGQHWYYGLATPAWGLRRLEKPAGCWPGYRGCSTACCRGSSYLAIRSQSDSRYATWKPSSGG
jgi:hypothetical protein